MQFPVLALRVGVVTEQGPQVDVGGPLRGREGADADVHLTVAEREDPAVSREDAVIGSTQLQVRRDPLVIAAARLDVAAGGHAVRRVAMPLAAEHAAELRACAVSDDQAAAGDLAYAVTRLDGDRRDAVAVARDIDRTRTLDGLRSRVEGDLTDRVIEFQARGGTAVVREIAAGPGQVEELVESGRPQPAIAGAALEPATETEGGQLCDGARSEAVTAGLVAGELLGVEEHGVEAGAGAPRSGGRARRPGADDEDVRGGHRPIVPRGGDLGDPRVPRV